MATYEVKGADGSLYHIDGPDDADPSAVIAQVAKQHRPQNLTQGADEQLVPVGSDAAKAAISPTAGMSGLDKFRTGAGKGFTDLVRGAGQMAGLESRQDIANSRQLDAPLMKTGAGRAGDIAGTAAGMLPAAFIPGANTMLGAAAVGAGGGLMAPSASTGETLGNTAGGAAMGPLALGIGRAGGALYQAGKGLIQPLFAKGQQGIAASALQSMAGDPAAQAAALHALQNAPKVLPGVQPTTAELANNGGLSQLERSVFNTPESISAMTARNQANRGAMTSALDSIAGGQFGARDAAVAARTAATKPLYAAASSATATSDDVLQELLQRPSLKSAWSRASQLADERGDSLVSGRDLPERKVNSSVLGPDGKPFSQTLPAESQSYSGRALQYLKMALQDMTSSGPQNGIGAHEVGALKSTLSDLNQWTAKNVPALRTADAAYADASKPINQMDVGQALRDKLVPAIGDFGNSSRLNAASFTSAVRNGDALAADATGQSGATLGSVLTPKQMTTVRQVGEQLARRVNANELGRAQGSNTAQNLISQNFLRQIAGPLGLPGSFAENTLANTLSRPIQFAGKLGQEKVTDILRKAALDPDFAAKLMQLQRNSPLAKILWQRQGLLSSAGAAAAPAPMGLLGNAQQQ